MKSVFLSSQVRREHRLRDWSQACGLLKATELKGSRRQIPRQGSGSRAQGVGASTSQREREAPRHLPQALGEGGG